MSRLLVWGTLLADLQEEFPLRREFQDQAILLTIAGEPDEAFVVDMDAVLVLRPIIAFARPAP